MMENSASRGPGTNQATMVITLVAVVVSCHGGPTALPRGAVCSEGGDCVGGLVCAYDRCRTTCTSDGHCEPGICLPTGPSQEARVCTLPAETNCGSDEQCAPPLTCAANGYCRLPCSGPCHDGQLCAAGHCYAEAHCGDGVRQADEQCDDGNELDDDDCLGNCRRAICGDGVVRQEGEACDDGNQINTDSCLNSCAIAECGDGVLWPEEESCDLGPLNEAGLEAPCRTDCTACGDGLVQEQDWSERCDNGSFNGQDNPTLTPTLCRLDCTFCGDGVVQANQGESCDDGNSDNHDFCLADCSARFVADPVPLELPAAELQLNGLWRSSDGLLYVASTDTTGHVVVLQSQDGETWSTTDLGSPGWPLRNPRLFEIAPGHLAVTARTEGNPEKSYLRDWTEDPATARDWLLLSAPLGAESRSPDHGVVMELADGSFVVFFDGGWHWVSPSLETIAAGAGDGSPLNVTPAREFPLVARHDARLFLLLLGEETFDLYESGDQLAFSQRSNATTGQTVRHGGLWYDDGGLLLCGTMASRGGTVQLWRLAPDDTGAWQVEEQPVPYVTNLNTAMGDGLACHIDATGVYVLYRDDVSGRALVLQPEAS